VVLVGAHSIFFEIHQATAQLSLQRAAAVRRALFRLPAGAFGDVQNAGP
jgi:hypothetical protein